MLRPKAKLSDLEKTGETAMRAGISVSFASPRAFSFWNPWKRDPDMRRRLIAETPQADGLPYTMLARNWVWMFPLNERPNYEPTASDSIAARAKAHGVTPEEEVYDLLLEHEGRGPRPSSEASMHRVRRTPVDPRDLRRRLIGVRAQVRQAVENRIERPRYFHPSQMLPETDMRTRREREVAIAFAE
jgi:hypothetical protein